MNFDHSKAATAVKIIHSHFIKYSWRLLFSLNPHITKLFSYFEYHKILHIWDEDFRFQGEGDIIQWINITPAILSITQKMVIGSASGYKNDNWKSLLPNQVSSATACLFQLFVLFSLPCSWSYFHISQYLLLVL